MLQLIAILSDIHGNSEALKAVIEDLKDDDLNGVIILGDLVDYGADSVRVVLMIRELEKITKVVCVRGNHDDSVIGKDCSRFRTEHGRQNFKRTLKDFESSSAIVDLRRLCQYSEIKYTGHNVVLVHASENDNLWGKSPRVSPFITEGSLKRPSEIHLVLGGHSHIQGWCMTDAGMYINPGSVGQPRNGDPRAQYAVCDDNFTEFKFRRVNYDVEGAASKIKNSGRPSFLSTRLYLGI